MFIGIGLGISLTFNGTCLKLCGFENQTVLHQTLRVLDLDGLVGLQFRILQRVAHVPLEQELGLNAKQL